MQDHFLFREYLSKHQGLSLINPRGISNTSSSIRSPWPKHCNFRGLHSTRMHKYIAFHGVENPTGNLYLNSIPQISPHFLKMASIQFCATKRF